MLITSNLVFRARDRIFKNVIDGSANHSQGAALVSAFMSQASPSGIAFQ